MSEGRKPTWQFVDLAEVVFADFYDDLKPIDLDKTVYVERVGNIYLRDRERPLVLRGENAFRIETQLKGKL